MCSVGDGDDGVWGRGGGEEGGSRVKVTATAPAPCPLPAQACT